MLPVPPPVCTATPVPVNATGVATPLTVREPVEGAGAGGVNVTEAVAVPLADKLRLAGETAKGPLVLSVTLPLADPLLVSVTVLAALVWPTLTLPNASEVGLTVIDGADPDRKSVM